MTKTFVANGPIPLAAGPDITPPVLPSEAVTALPDAGLVPLQSILCTEELNKRPSRQPDYESENNALKSLVQALANSPRTILQTLADTILKVFKADSAGLSLLTKDEKRFYWPAIAGGWQPHIGGGTPRDFGPCGDVLDCNAPLLFKHWERRYPYLIEATPPAEEGLLVPFYVEGKAVGTIWAIAHSEQRKFDSEDLRQLESLAQFASSAYQAVAFQETLEKSKTEVIQGVVQLDKAEASRDLAETLIRRLHDEIEEHKQAEEAQARLVAIVESSEDAILSKDLNGTIASWNRGAEHLFGYTAEEAVGKSVTMLIPQDRVNEEPALLERIRRGESIEHYETVRRHKDGTLLDISLTLSPIRNRLGKVIGASKIARDITEHKKAENALRDSEERYRNLFTSMDEGFCVLQLIYDKNDKPVDDLCLEANPSFEKQTGISNAAGARARQNAPDHEPDCIENYHTVIQTGEPVRFIKESPALNRWFDVHAFRVGNAADRKVAVIFNDITERKWHEEALRKSRQELDHHAQKLETQVVDRTAKLSESIKSLESLNYTMAHDLRAPIRAMKSFATALLEDVPLNETGKTYAVRINKAATRMDQLVNDLLDYGELSHLEFPVHALDLKTEITKVLAENAVEIQTAHAEIQLLEPLPNVCGNETLLQQILSNLTLNALKFVAPGVKPHLRIWAEEVGPVTPCGPVEASDSAPEQIRPTIRLWLEDNGIGIDPKHQEQIFGIFQRLHTTEAFPGTGVGLAIIKRAAERMGGSVGVESALDKGSRFWLELPNANAGNY
ncbi:MAG: multi-sensor hybrid histidine kinase [Verrucomicrobiales bacterium]|nr:multi-sensor hybrid histidine kinase [Verrucomicrobiales bacterium]